MKKLKVVIMILAIFASVNCLTGCALMVVGGLAGTTGYLAAKQGYGVRSPITKSKNKSGTHKNNSNN